MPPPRSTSPAAARAGGAFSPDTETDPHPTTHINTDYILASLDLILTARPPGLEHVARLQSHADLAKLQRLQAKQIRALATAIRRARARTKSPAEKSKVCGIPPAARSHCTHANVHAPGIVGPGDGN